MTKPETLRDAFERFLRDYRTEGCPHPDCTVCRRSKQALDDFRTLLSHHPSPAGDDVERVARAILDHRLWPGAYDAAKRNDPSRSDLGRQEAEQAEDEARAAIAALAAAPGRVVEDNSDAKKIANLLVTERQIAAHEKADLRSVVESLFGAALNEMAANNLPLEWQADCPLGKASEALYGTTDYRIALEMFRRDHGDLSTAPTPPVPAEGNER